MRSDKEIKDQIARLQAVKKRVQRRNFFGEDNHAKIDAEITVLEERLTENDCFDRTAEEGEDDDSKEWDWNTGESARDAAMWLAGDSDEDPASGWEEIAD